MRFYETFLAAHDPALRGARGVYVTPEPVARYLVRAAGDVLEAAFGIAADAPGGDVVVLDPACGTGVFLHELIAGVRARFIERGEPAAWQTYVRTTLLRRLTGFELLLAPYAVAHAQIALALGGAGLGEPLRSQYRYELGPDDRVRVGLTNALGGGAAVDDALAPAHVLVVLGNPPYSGHSANPRGAQRNGRGRPARDGPSGGYAANAGEANVKWLHDDYVKFIRFAEDRVERAGRGIVAFVTNHAYLDNPTFAGMRRHLMRTFDENLRARSPRQRADRRDGARRRARQNVFDIRQGVAIGIFVNGRPGASSRCAVRFAELYGDRRAKYDWLSTATMQSTPWTTVAAERARRRSGRPRRHAARVRRRAVARGAMPVSSLGSAHQARRAGRRVHRARAARPAPVVRRPAAAGRRDRGRVRSAGARQGPLGHRRRRRAAANADPANVRRIQYRCGDFR